MVRAGRNGDLTNEEARAHALESLSLCPPSSSETLPVPIGVFRRWLAGVDTDDDSADVEGVRTRTEADAKHSAMNIEDMSPADRRIVRWRGAATSTEEDITSEPVKIRPGDVIVIPANHPGPWYPLGDLPPGAAEPAAILDVGDHAYLLAHARPILRLHPALVEACHHRVVRRSRAPAGRTASHRDDGRPARSRIPFL